MFDKNQVYFVIFDKRKVWKGSNDLMEIACTFIRNEVLDCLFLYFKKKKMKNKDLPQITTFFSVCLVFSSFHLAFFSLAT